MLAGVPDFGYSDAGSALWFGARSSYSLADDLPSGCWRAYSHPVACHFSLTLQKLEFLMSMWLLTWRTVPGRRMRLTYR